MRFSSWPAADTLRRLGVKGSDLVRVSTWDTMLPVIIVADFSQLGGPQPPLSGSVVSVAGAVGLHSSLGIRSSVPFRAQVRNLVATHLICAVPETALFGPIGAEFSPIAAYSLPNPQSGAQTIWTSGQVASYAAFAVEQIAGTALSMFWRISPGTMLVVQNSIVNNALQVAVQVEETIAMEQPV